MRQLRVLAVVIIVIAITFDIFLKYKVPDNYRIVYRIFLILSIVFIVSVQLIKTKRTITIINPTVIKKATDFLKIHYYTIIARTFWIYLFTLLGLHLVQLPIHTYLAWAFWCILGAYLASSICMYLFCNMRHRS